MTPDTLKKLGGKRPGSGRKPKPDKLVSVQARIRPDLKLQLVEGAERAGLTVSQFIALAIERYLNLNP